MFAIIQLNPTEQSNPSQPLNFGNPTNLSGPSYPSHRSSTPKPPNPSTPCNQCSTLGPAGVGHATHSMHGSPNDAHTHAYISGSVTDSWAMPAPAHYTHLGMKSTTTYFVTRLIESCACVLIFDWLNGHRHANKITCRK